jgi:hypothetical protein
LHDVLQTAFGWQNRNLHEFRIGGRTFGRPDWEDDFMGQSPPEDERRARLHSVLSAVGAKATYLYDFGDNWEHEIVVEQLHPDATDRRYPVCVDGWGQCPPEDCGGIPGYESLVLVMQNRTTLNTPTSGDGWAASSIPTNSQWRVSTESSRHLAGAEPCERDIETFRGQLMFHCPLDEIK